MKNVLEYLENTTENNKDKIAIVEENRRSSYLEVLQTSKKIGSELTKYVVPRSPVPILAEKGIDALYSFFGAVYAGCFYILLNPELPVSRLERILEVLDTKVLLTDNEHIELAKQIGVNHQILKISDLKEKEIKHYQQFGKYYAKKDGMIKYTDIECGNYLFSSNQYVKQGELLIDDYLYINDKSICI